MITVESVRHDQRTDKDDEPLVGQSVLDHALRRLEDERRIPPDLGDGVVCAEWQSYLP